ncbi:ABC transporter ATP-binding protein [Pseudothermotoga lettingae]|uniref:Oligopeptide/dipeptide ABC transporter, ATPase subunit n=1 Tax=Pseudothermotoga lettingae (strain ATCC BAA-301 / DSM 14385 / NBRC 107922 / TMO) TaxID=416591 RepID=A8F3B3_PSELT|nr:ABC transporter ATP-binding protein [Pseudothermotoga lettingae]ABV32647.1 oligopeptide/dipeptide ABC transporter, ATPase subunit [Pseudothermotoga lettingae TMO]GLI48362.1 peptide ABC transporter ATP-binding protein [Pseudothermotoga lettingae TMO]
MKSLLTVEDLAVEFRISNSKLRAPDGISFSVMENECVGLVGESGSGKSVTALAIMNLVPAPQGRIIRGKIIFEGLDLLAINKHPRGTKISMVFQNPMNSLNPNIKIGKQLTEVLQEHYNLNYREAMERVIRVMQELGIPDPEKMIDRYPFEYSGGMRQRTMIAMAVLCNPKLLIADEPTTALDVTIQAQIIQLFKKLKEKSRTSILFISHDLSVISQIADRIIVMYAGKICEISPTTDLFRNPLHPYTAGLINSIPGANERGTKLMAIPGNIPDLTNPPEGCRFHPRCSRKLPICSRKEPPVILYEQRSVSCWLYEGVNT